MPQVAPTGPVAPRIAPAWVRRAALGVLVAGHLWALYGPPTTGEPWFPGDDKVVHVLLFGLPTLVALLIGLPARWVLPLAALHAPISELVQHWFLPLRSGDPLDAAADLLGVAAAWATWRRLSRGSRGSRGPRSEPPA